MSKDREERDRGLSALQGLGMIVFGAILAIVAADYDYSWQGFLLAGISFVLGVYTLACAVRD
jgi:hypothetical protein